MAVRHGNTNETFTHELVPLQMVAVLQFSGYAVREAAESARQRLIQALEYGEHSWTCLLKQQGVDFALMPSLICSATRTCG